MNPDRMVATEKDQLAAQVMGGVSGKPVVAEAQLSDAQVRGLLERREALRRIDEV
jgi:hypothetical protein